MHRGRDPLPLRWSLVVAHEIVDIMQQRLRLGEVGVAQQIDVKVRHGHRVDAGSHGVGYEVSAAWRVVQPRGEMYRQVAIGGIERGALGVFRVETGEVEKQIAVHIRRREEDLAKLHLAQRLRLRRDPLQRPQQAAIAHTVGDDVHLHRPAVRGEVHEEIRNRPLAGLDARLIHRISRHAAARGPTEERRCSWHLQVVADLRRADRRVCEGDVEPMQEKQRVRPLAAVACGLHRLVDVREEGDFCISPRKGIFQ
jgi:hypothetical protein